MELSNQFINMMPYYLMGIAMMVATYFSPYRSFLSVKIKPILKFCLFLSAVTAIRCITNPSTITPEEAERTLYILNKIHWDTVFMVFWEDAVHTLPLGIVYSYLERKNKYKFLYYPLLLITMVSFGLGHTYQGVGAAFMLSFYIPLAKRLGMRNGFGTVMICHIMYDLVTLYTMKVLLEAM